tara:strand:+ start:1155 stop:1625 length:471 start_codon:yes stop_codon:yes gene_type:complete
MKFKIFKIIFLIAFLLNTQFSYGEILKPNTSILPSEVVKIQLNGLQQNNLPKEDFGIMQTWEFAHPKNKIFTGPYDKFKSMIKKDSYSILINHKAYEINEIFKNENVATYEVTILARDKKFYKFKWQVEKYNKDGPLKGCWLTTAVLAPKELGSSV